MLFKEIPHNWQYKTGLMLVKRKPPQHKYFVHDRIIFGFPDKLYFTDSQL